MTSTNDPNFYRRAAEAIVAAFEAKAKEAEAKPDRALRPCPACGGEDQEVDYYQRDMPVWSVRCKCGVHGPEERDPTIHFGEMRAIASWNALPRKEDAVKMYPADIMRLAAELIDRIGLAARQASTKDGVPWKETATVNDQPMGC